MAGRKGMQKAGGARKWQMLELERLPEDHPTRKRYERNLAKRRALIKRDDRLGPLDNPRR